MDHKDDPNQPEANDMSVVPTLLEIVVRQGNVEVRDIPGGKMLLIQAVNGITISLPLRDEVAQEIGRKLSGTALVVADRPLSKSGRIN